MKKCFGCKVEKEDFFFSKKKGCKDGLQPYCKYCSKVNIKKYQIENKDKIRNKQKEYRINNKDKIKEYNSNLYIKNRADRINYSKNKREEIKINVEKNGLSLPDIKEKKCRLCLETKSVNMFYVRKTQNRYTEICKDCKKKEAKKYREDNKEKIAIYKKEYNKNDTDINRKIGIRLRKRVLTCINSIESKTKLKNKLLDCSKEFLKKWFLYNLDLDNMSFENYNDWHIDHVIPCSVFDLTKQEDIEKCFHWTNIRPLDKRKNLAKSNKILWPDIFVQEIRLKKFIKNNHVNEYAIQKWISGALTTAVL